MKRYISLVIVFFVVISIFIYYGRNKNVDTYINKRLAIKFDIPSNWQRNYKIINIKKKNQYEIAVFKSEIKDEEVILLELWTMDKKMWDYKKDFYKLNKVAEYNGKVYAYSRPDLKTILENIGEDIKREEGEFKEEIFKIYINNKDIENRLHINFH